MVKKVTTETIPSPAPITTTDSANSIPIIALVLGCASLVTFMWFLGIPAIILGIIGLRRYKENRGFSIAGLVSGIISTVLLIGAIFFFIAMFAIILTSNDPDAYLENNPPRSYDTPYEREYDRFERGAREGI